MSIVTLVSGGLDSTVMAMLAAQQGMEQHPLFINYGQLNAEREWSSCSRNFGHLGLPTPTVLEIPGFGRAVRSGLTDRTLHLVDDAFLPCRNLLFLTLAAAVASQRGATGVSIGLLSEEYSIFPDQTADFIHHAEESIARALPVRVRLRAPLMHMSKKDSVAVAKQLGIAETYSCHAGEKSPCGECIACREFNGLEV